MYDECGFKTPPTATVRSGQVGADDPPAPPTFSSACFEIALELLFGRLVLLLKAPVKPCWRSTRILAELRSVNAKVARGDVDVATAGDQDFCERSQALVQCVFTEFGVSSAVAVHSGSALTHRIQDGRCPSAGGLLRRDGALPGVQEIQVLEQSPAVPACPKGSLILPAPPGSATLSALGAYVLILGDDRLG